MPSLVRRRRVIQIATVATFSAFVLTFQNCANNYKLSAIENASQADAAGGGASGVIIDTSGDTLSTNEDTPVNGQVKTVADQAGQASTYASLMSPSSGTISNLDPIKGTFTYTPKSHFFGEDHFQLTEDNPGYKSTILRDVVVKVGRTGQPYIVSDIFNFELNSKNNAIVVKVGDNEASDAQADLSVDHSMTSIATKYGTLVKTADGFSYTPNAEFRGTDKATFYVADSKGGSGSREVKLIVGNPLTSIQPGMAVRAANCIQCHAQISSNFVTDFGFGDPYYFAHNQKSPVSGDWIYSLRMAGTSTWSPDWITSAAFANNAQLVVPKADLGFKFADYAPAAADKTQPWMLATTLADLMTKIQSIKGATFKANVVEKDKVYIGSPSVPDIKAAGQLDATHPLQYWKDSDQSYDLSGFTLASGGYYTNSGPLVCDGDLFVDGTVYLDTVQIKTINGCRLHATGPVFMQKAITYVTDPALATNPNLQIVSARAISMGIGLTHCEAQTNPSGWYNANKVASPMVERFSTLVVGKGEMTRNTNPASGFPQTAASPTAEGAYIVNEAKKIAGLDDASCHGRALTFERLMLVAPQVHSRYKGNFSGVVISEIPLFSLQSFIYVFDPVFTKVPILPLIDVNKYLVIQ